MKTKKILLFILFILSIHSFAQPKFEEKKDQIKALKVSFITNELSLTSDEAARFWPIYNEFDDKQFELRHRKMKSFNQRLDDDFNKMSEKDAIALLTQMQNTEDEIYQNQKKFMSNVKKVLSPLQIIKLKKAEIDFNKKLLQQYRHKGQRN